MRLLLYNIAYGTGGPSAFSQQFWTFHRYVRTPRSHLDRIARFIDESEADVVGLVEVDTGSYRTDYLNQVEVIANRLRHYPYSRNKYGEDSIWHRFPFLRKQANAILTRENAGPAIYHYLPCGFKRLIIEVDVGGVRVILVHLSLRYATRRRQIECLSDLLRDEPGSPLIVAGDFNLLRGEEEIGELAIRHRLVNANSLGISTYPSWNPARQLDFILCSPEIEMDAFHVSPIRHSDHLPLILDFHVR
jgi:endonuclease/exonuclease/phosphatase family metal-dependent hydrolase